MRAATLFSGIGAPECAMPSWDWLWHAEIEKFPNAVMTARHPQSKNLGNVNGKNFVSRAVAIGKPDVLIFGSPCQDFSIAGHRLGLAGARGNMALQALAVAQQLGVEWLVFENVPGLFSSYSGSAEAERSLRDSADRALRYGQSVDAEEDSDLAAFLSAVRECGYLGCWRVFDSQYFGVPQRRRRVFFVGRLGDWRGPAAVLFEPESLRGDSPPRRESGQDVAPTISARPTAGGGLGTDFDLDGGLIASTGDIAHCLNAGSMGRIDYETETMVAHALRAEGFDASEDVVPALNGADAGATSDMRPVVMMREGVRWVVRRLTPTECERLQGFPDGYTAIEYRGKPAQDGPRYKALGNSMTVKVMRHILTRLESVDTHSRLVGALA